MLSKFSRFIFPLRPFSGKWRRCSAWGDPFLPESVYGAPGSKCSD